MENILNRFSLIDFLKAMEYRMNILNSNESKSLKELGFIDYSELNNTIVGLRLFMLFNRIRDLK